MTDIRLNRSIIDTENQISDQVKIITHCAVISQAQAKQSDISHPVNALFSSLVIIHSWPIKHLDNTEVINRGWEMSMTGQLPKPTT